MSSDTPAEGSPEAQAAAGAAAEAANRQRVRQGERLGCGHQRRSWGVWATQRHDTQCGTCSPPRIPALPSVGCVTFVVHVQSLCVFSCLHHRAPLDQLHTLNTLDTDNTTDPLACCCMLLCRAGEAPGSGGPGGIAEGPPPHTSAGAGAAAGAGPVLACGRLRGPRPQRPG